MAISTLILWLCLILSSDLMKSMALDTIRAHQIIRDGETITSAGEEFELGFFSPSRSTKRYLGIWYKKISNGTVIWVANRDAPVMNTSGILRVSDRGLSLQTGNQIIWSTNTSIFMKNPVVLLLDSGNLVVRDGDHDMNRTEDFIWQSFDYPTDNLLPGMKMGIDLVTGLERYLTSWKSANDPSTGSFTDRLNPKGFPQFFRSKDSAIWSRTGPWNGLQFTGSPRTNQNGMYTEKFVFNDKEIYYRLDPLKPASADLRFTLTPYGEIEFQVWNHQIQKWIVYVTMGVYNCDQYKLCGANGFCKVSNSPRCECLTGFIPQFAEKWKAGDWSGGCVRKEKLDCGSGTNVGFLKYTRVKLPDTQHSWYDMRINLEQCRRLCLNNCSCIAYANADIRSGGSGCILWFSELSDIKGYTEEGEDMYVKMASSDLVYSLRSRVKRLMWIVLLPTVIALTSLYMFLLWKRKQNRQENLKLSSESVALTELESEDWELPSVDFKRIVNATDNFSPKNKLGEGGFGPVYKGIWNDGHEIAVKRLSKHSGQGQDEFINEVSCIAKLQHRNLVTLLGCCTEKGERILIYEYMANKSLDSFIFDKELRNSMDWLQRYNIINGIARGLLYLHQDSKLRIIHRDLKASNILLDHEMNPKISDFGMARCFRGSQTEDSTTRIVGTYGYMSPEYAIDGQFSVKSDVYSFGVILIEIVSGNKNRLFNHADRSLNLLGHAWRSYTEDKLLGLVDEVLLESSNQIELFRVIQIGLLCVQEDPIDRPFMSDVVLMLSSKMQLPRPKKPGFFMARMLQDTDHLLHESKFSSCNRLTITSLPPRQ